MQRKRKPLTQLTIDDQEKRRRSENDTQNNFEEINVRAGTVSRIVLKNFMCHSHLEVTFNQNINYVIGRNGSGKSAILTSLIVGLGGKASLTNRGNSIKGFIKAGKNSGSVEVTLRNEGPMAYKNNDYGNEIIIIRNITASGSSSYKIKSALGEVVSTQSKEVRNICTNLNIQIDNPVCLLNQDTSRNFLSSKDPRQKFILFMRATRLEILLEEYKKMSIKKNEASRLFREQETLFEELQQKLRVLQRKMLDQKSIISLKENVVSLQQEIMWSKVKDAECDMNTEQESVNNLTTELCQMELDIQNNAQILEEYQQSIQTLQHQIIELQNSIHEQNDPQNSLVRVLGELKQKISEKQREKRNVVKEIAFKSGNCNILKNEIDQFTENCKQIEENKVKRLQEIKTLEGKIKDIEGLLETSNNDQFQMRNSVNRVQEQEHNVLMEIREIDSEIGRTQTRLNSLKADSDVLSLYSRDMPRIVEAIKRNESKFIHTPRGPLGSYITLKDKKWAVAVEGFLTPNLMCAFTVDNKTDNQLLMKIFQEVCSRGQKPMIITAKFFLQVHDVSPNLVRPVGECISVFSALEISDPVVANCLIDQISLESVLLIPNNNTAIKLMSDQSHVPKNCRQGITIKGDRYYPDPNYKTYGSRYHTARYLQVSRADVIRQLEDSLHNLSSKKQLTETNLQSVRKDSAEQIKNAKALEVKINKLAKALLQLKRNLSDAQNTEDLEVANIETLRNEYEELTKTIENKKEVETKLQAELEELKGKISKKEDKLNNIKNIVRGYEDRIELINTQVREKQTKKKELDVNKRFANNRLDTCRKQLKSARNSLVEKKKIVETRESEAVELCPRLENLRDVPTIVKELNEKQKAIRQIEANMESSEVIKQKYQECKAKNIQATEFMNTVRSNINELNILVNKCNQKYKHTEDYFITFIKYSFKKVLELRQFQGSLEIDTNAKHLDLVVIPQQGSQGYTTTSNLSGGERSFSTVAFLYSLWQCMEFPFYFLDEFDVFMDKVNRSKVMEILLYHAKKHSDMQFVFLTPQDISFLNDKSIAVHKLDDPQRGEAVTNL